jgi:hypothetical protein
MQTVTAAFTAEEKDTVRSIAENLQVSWHRQSTLGNRTFTIGISTIGGNDLIGINPGAIGSPANYRYFDETNYLMRLAWERGLHMPTGGLTMALAEALLDNTSRRFTPRYMGGNSEIATAILPSRPAIINAGFNVDGVDITLPQFAGLITDQPHLDQRSRTLAIKMADYMRFFQNKSMDQAAMFTGSRTDEIIQTLLRDQLGMNTAQYSLDVGINIIPFVAIDVGTKMADIIGQLVEAENGHFYQDESGKFRFENRQKWTNSPYNQVQKVISTAQVINAEAPNDDHLINVVEVSAEAFAKQPEQIIFRLNPFDSLVIPSGSTVDLFVNFSDPVLSMTTPTSAGTASFFQAFSSPDGSGTDLTSSISVNKVTRFAQAAKVSFTNSGSVSAYLTSLVITGRVARSVSQIYTRATAGHSITAYQEHLLTISNKFIQNQSWAESYAQMILQDFSSPENIQRITIKAFPELQLGDLVSWQGRYWRIYDIKTTLDPSQGFIQELLMLQRTITTYFRIGVSTIGGSDIIAP